MPAVIQAGERDFDAAPGSAARLGVRSVPTLVRYPDGKPAACCARIPSGQQPGALFDRLLPRVRRLA